MEPGDTHTNFTASRILAAHTSPDYEKRLKASVERMAKDEQNGAPPEAVAKVICKLAGKKNPPYARPWVSFTRSSFSRTGCCRQG